MPRWRRCSAPGRRTSLCSARCSLTQEAIRVAGGRAFLKRYPLERHARDARAAALMRPWTQEIAMQQAWQTALGVDAVYLPEATIREPR